MNLSEGELHRRFRARGTSMVELMFVMAILAGAFVAVLSSINFIANGMFAERVHADQFTRTTSTLYDLVSELREATIYSPNFYIEQNPSKPPLIVFDKVDTVDSTGKMVWGSKITYRLEQVSSTSSSTSGGGTAIVSGRIVREETAANSIVPPMTTVIEENVPYQYTLRGVRTWGFNVTLDGCALTVTTSRFGDTGIESGDDSASSSQLANGGNASTFTASINNNSSAAPEPNGTSSSTQGTVAIFTVRGTYYLRNPQEIISAQ